MPPSAAIVATAVIRVMAVAEGGFATRRIRLHAVAAARCSVSEARQSVLAVCQCRFWALRYLLPKLLHELLAEKVSYTSETIH